MKTENRPDSHSKTIPANDNTPKPKLQRSPINPPTVKVNHRKKKQRRTPQKGMIS